ncbi:glycosyltransferase family 4 protein [Bradyrhizobium sp. PMVTL-01]|uniref:glycosyltransferase family 4 protein n=1 Tax=Bradyrhizobium sp. PMVTL-01 TaxID=3434999 RepID=UPI003F706A4E
MRKTVAIVAPHFPEYSLEYGAALSRYCEVLVCLDEGQLTAEYSGQQIPKRLENHVRAFRFKTAMDLVRLVRTVARARPDVVHLQEAVGPRRRLFNALLVMAVKRSSKIALTIHDPSPHPGRDGDEARRGLMFRDYVRRRADVVIVHGEYCREQYRLSEPGFHRRMVVSAHGTILSPERFRAEPSGHLKMYFFGRMEEYKGLKVLCRAAEILHKEGLPFSLKVAGKGPELDKLQDRLKKLPEVTVLNAFVPRLDVISSMQEADCVVLPYTSATQSGIAAAAFANHRFVIASRIGGLPDVVKHMDNGLLFESGAAEELVRAIRTVAFDPGLRKTLRDGARRTAQNELNWDRIAEVLSLSFFE